MCIEKKALVENTYAGEFIILFYQLKNQFFIFDEFPCYSFDHMTRFVQ